MALSLKQNLRTCSSLFHGKKQEEHERVMSKRYHSYARRVQIVSGVVGLR